MKVPGRKNLFQLLADNTAQNKTGENILLETSQEKFSYEDTFTSVRKTARFLTAQNIERNDKIIILLPNGIDFIISFFAALAKGAVVVPLDINLEEELRQILVDTKPGILFTTPGIFTKKKHIIDEFGEIKIVLTNESEFDNNRTFSLPLILRNYSQELDLTPSSCHDDVCILYTSGTTGFQKGIIKTNGNLITEIEELHNIMALSTGDKFFSVIPWYHIYGMIHSLLLPICAGSQIYYLNRYTPRSLINLIKNKKASIFVGVPLLYQILSKLKTKEAGYLESLRFGISSGSPLNKDIVQSLDREYGLRLVELYGSTESGAITINLDKRNYPESVGACLSTIELKILNEKKAEVSGTHEGEIIVKGPTVSSRFFQNGQIHSIKDSNSWYFTGDIGNRDNMGYIYIKGRNKHIIKKGSKKVSLREIELVLQEISEVEDVVVDVKENPLYGQIVKAYIVLNKKASLSEEGILKFCRTRLAGYKLPKEISFLDKIPRNANGKVIYSKLN